MDDFDPEVEIDIIDYTRGPFEEVRILTKAQFSVRPFVQECLEFANKHFEVAIFTAGQKWFADPIIDHLDPTKSLI